MKCILNCAHSKLKRAYKSGLFFRTLKKKLKGKKLKKFKNSSHFFQKLNKMIQKLNFSETFLFLFTNRIFSIEKTIHLKQLKETFYNETC